MSQNIKNTLEVHTSEDGQKLLQFLVRRLGLPQSLLHRWIRTGQIRVNGKRVKPFVHVHTLDMVRMPPFAVGMTESAQFSKEIVAPIATNSPHFTPSGQHTNEPLPPSVYTDENLIIFNKPQGLPVHTGTGHTDSLATRLAEHFTHLTFKPTPAHRIDKDTSGIICVALSYNALRTLQNAFENRTINKEYLAWVQGLWPHKEAQLLQHTMGKKYVGYDERMRILQQDEHGNKDARCLVRCLEQRKNCSLMHIRLITGRTHQIRLQLAAMGHPVLGDGKYGTAQPQLTLCLHSLRVTFPATLEFSSLQLAGQSFAAFPSHAPWDSALAIDTLPNIFPDHELDL